MRTRQVFFHRPIVLVKEQPQDHKRKHQLINLNLQKLNILRKASVLHQASADKSESPKTEYLKKSISFRGPKIWNSLSEQARNSESLSIFNANISS